MHIHISDDAASLGDLAAKTGASLIKNAIAKKGAATVILATGTSQFEMLKCLVHEPGIEWSRVTMFHLDEYLGLPEVHPASFRKYLKERFLGHVQVGVYHLINGEADGQLECARLSDIIASSVADVAFIGIGENGHLAFNDPPADFRTEDPYIVVTLDEACRKQQLGEGWFASLDEVPRYAISMSIRQIMKSRHIICSVPDERKAVAIRNSLDKEIGPMYPSTVLRAHPACYLFLDKASASLLSPELISGTYG
jgi:glucosamine-6-phosphate deaminase